MKCQKCGAEINGKFCSECGTPAPQSTSKFCSNCGKELTPGKAFCGFCGTSVNSVTPSFQQVSYPPVTPKKKNRGCLKSALIVVLVLMVSSIVLNGLVDTITNSVADTENTSSSVSSNIPTSEEAPSSSAANEKSYSSSYSKPNVNGQTKTKYTIGDTVIQKDIRVTLEETTLSNGSGFSQPTEGNVFIIFEFEIANNSSEDMVFSSILCSSAYCDNYALDESITALVANDKQSLGGTIAPGRKLKGALAYEIPVNWNTVEVVLDFSSLFDSRDEIIFGVKNIEQ